MSLTTTISQMNSALDTGVFALSLGDMDATLTSASDRFSIVSASFSDGVTTVIFSDSGTADGYICKLYSDSELTTLIDTQFSDDLEVKFANVTVGVQYWMTVTEGSLEVIDPAPSPISGTDSSQGDFEALQALYNNTQGNDAELPTLASSADLPSIGQATYPYMYMIGGEIWHLRYERMGDGLGGLGFIGWENAGAPWTDKTGWDTMTVETMGDAVGITVDANNRVTEIDMQKVNLEPYGAGQITVGNNLVGKIPALMGNLKKLRKFNIKQNFFFGEIPTEMIENCTLMERYSFGGQRSEIGLTEERSGQPESQVARNVYINDHFSPSVDGKEIGAYNRLTGQMPDFENLLNLELIECRHQYLTGTLPEIINCPSVKGIFFDSQRNSVAQGISGSIPSSWGDSPLVMKLSLGNEEGFERLSGPFPTEVTDNWTGLRVIYIPNNKFTGDMPEFLNSRNKSFISLTGNLFTGGFPIGYFNGDNSELNSLSIGNNPLGGELPADIPYPTYPNDRSEGTAGAGYWWLGILRIYKCGFTGNLPDWTTTKLPRLRIFTINDNNLTGAFPVGLQDQTLIKTIYLNDNNLSGALPDRAWSTTVSFLGMDIGGNDFTGPIPASWESLYLDASGNPITSLRDNNWSDNNFEGVIPDWMNASAESIWRNLWSGNKFTFKDILPNIASIEAAFSGDFVYHPQQPFATITAKSYSVGDTIFIDLTTYDYTGNVFTWRRDGTIVLQGSNEAIFEKTAELSDSGLYTVEITNPSAPDLTLTTNGIDSEGNISGSFEITVT